MLYKTYNQTTFSGYKKSLLYHSVALAHFVRICTDKGQVQDGAKDWYSPDKAYNHWKEAPEQEKKTIDLEQNSNNGPANQHHKHSSQEETGGLHLVLLEKEAEGPLKADDKGESSNEENISNSQKCFVKEQDHPEEEEKHAEAC